MENNLKVGHAKVFSMLEGISRDNWLRMRSAGIGGSDVAQICEISNWGNPLSVYLDKLDPGRDDSTSEAAEIGNAVEAFVADEWERRNPYGYKLEVVPAILQHPEHPWALANIDRLVVDEEGNQVGVYEGKSGGLKDPWKDDAIPDDYYLQGQWYLGVTGLPRIFYAALLGGYGGLSVALREREADQALIENLLQIGERFWRMVEARTPPAVDGSRVSEEILKELYGQAEKGTTVELAPSVALTIAAYLEAKAATKEAELEEKRLANEIKNLMGTHERAICGDFHLSWTNVTTNKLNTKAIQQAHPNLCSQFTTPSTYRRFGIKERK